MTECWICYKRHTKPPVMSRVAPTGMYEQKFCLIWRRLVLHAKVLLGYCGILVLSESIMSEWTNKKKSILHLVRKKKVCQWSYSLYICDILQGDLIIWLKVSEFLVHLCPTYMLWSYDLLMITQFVYIHLRCT